MIENNELQTKNTNKILIIIPIIILFIAISFSLWKVYSNKEAKSNNDNLENITDDDSTKEDNIITDKDTNPDDGISSFDKSYSLSEIEESYSIIDSLLIKFIGSPISEVEDKYKYVAEITLNDKKINTGLFEDTNEKVIYSKDFAAQFNVKKINNLYVLQSIIGAQFGGTYFVVLNQNGDVLLKGSNVRTDFTLKNDEKYLTVTSYSDSPSMTDIGTEERYLIEENSITLKK